MAMARETRFPVARPFAQAVTIAEKRRSVDLDRIPGFGYFPQNPKDGFKRKHARPSGPFKPAVRVCTRYWSGRPSAARPDERENRCLKEEAKSHAVA
jgi:hypothetical protein